MGAGDRGEPPEGGTGDPARPGEAEPERSADEDQFEALFECLGGIGKAGANAREFLETAQQLLSSDAPAVPRLGEVVAYCVRQAADSILDTAGSSPEDQRWEDLSRDAVDAFKEYERERRFAEDSSEAALTDPLAGLRAAMGRARPIPRRGAYAKPEAGGGRTCMADRLQRGGRRPRSDQVLPQDAEKRGPQNCTAHARWKTPNGCCRSASMPCSDSSALQPTRAAS